MRRQLILNGNPMEDVAGFARAVRVAPIVSVVGTAPVDPAGRSASVIPRRRRGGALLTPCQGTTDRPPSTGMTCPDVKRASRIRNSTAAAISSGVPIRLSGVLEISR